jgi:WD40 repeat protein
MSGRKRKDKSDSSQSLANTFGAMNTTEHYSASPGANPNAPLPASSQPQLQQGHVSNLLSSPTNANQSAISSAHLDDIMTAADLVLPDSPDIPVLHETVSPKPVSGDTRTAESTPAEANTTPKFSFTEVSCLRASTSKVLCCHFSADGKLLASAGHDKKVNVWNMNTLKLEHTLEEHLLLITDVRFSPTSHRLATSSYDKTVKVWEIGNPTCSIRSFQGHATSVMALDFHPNNEDLLCSCDGDSEIRYWSVSQGTCIKSFKGGVTQLRFQSRIGRFLAAAAENVVTIFDVDLDSSVYCLLNHSKAVSGLCWSASGDFLVSLTEDYVKVWSIGSSNENGERSKCRYELSCKEKMFQSCVFHPNYPSLLVIGCYQALELWNMVENKIMNFAAHDALIVSLVACPITGLVASASHDKCVKLWQ